MLMTASLAIGTHPPLNRRLPPTPRGPLGGPVCASRVPLPDVVAAECSFPALVDTGAGGGRRVGRGVLGVELVAPAAGSIPFSVPGAARPVDTWTRGRGSASGAPWRGNHCVPRHHSCLSGLILTRGGAIMARHATTTGPRG